MARERREERSFSFVTTCIMYTYSVSVEIQNSHSLHKLWQLVPGGQPLMVWRLKQSPSATASCSTIVFYITGWGLCLPAWSWLCSCFRLCFLPAPAVVVASCRFWHNCRNHRKQRVNSTSHCCCHLYILLSLQHSSAEGREEATVTHWNWQHVELTACSQLRVG